MISTAFLGRSGNNLFQYAMARTVAERNEYKFYFVENDCPARELMKLDYGKSDGTLKTIFKEEEHKYNASVFNVPDYTCFWGYWQSEKYFDHVKVKEWFKVQPTELANRIHYEYPIDKYCYLNLRGTDVKLISSQKLHIEYYNNAREKMKSILPDIQFIVVTDDVEYGKEYFPDYIVMRNDIKTDFYLLHSAKYLIMANSSFAWWAAWLNSDNIVIAPQGWHNRNINKWENSPKDIAVDRWIWV